MAEDKPEDDSQDMCYMERKQSTDSIYPDLMRSDRCCGQARMNLSHAGPGGLNSSSLGATVLREKSMSNRNRLRNTSPAFG